MRFQGIVVRPRREDDEVFSHTVEPVGDYVALSGGEVVANGGFLRHYNPPFADVFMEFRPDWRHRELAPCSCRKSRRPVT